MRITVVVVVDSEAAAELIEAARSMTITRERESDEEIQALIEAAASVWVEASEAFFAPIETEPINPQPAPINHSTALAHIAWLLLAIALARDRDD